MPIWEHKSVPITFHRSGELRLQDLEAHKQILVDAGWEYIDMRVLPAKHEDVADAILGFRKRKGARQNATRARPAQLYYATFNNWYRSARHAIA